MRTSFKSFKSERQFLNVKVASVIEIVSFLVIVFTFISSILLFLKQPNCSLAICHSTCILKDFLNFIMPCANIDFQWNALKTTFSNWFVWGLLYLEISSYEDKTRLIIGRFINKYFTSQLIDKNIVWWKSNHNYL